MDEREERTDVGIELTPRQALSAFEVVRQRAREGKLDLAPLARRMAPLPRYPVPKAKTGAEQRERDRKGAAVKGSAAEQAVAQRPALSGADRRVMHDE